MANCPCGSEIDVPGNSECRFCFIKATLLPIIKEWLREAGDNTRVMRRATLAYIEELERRLAEKEKVNVGKISVKKGA